MEYNTSRPKLILPEYGRNIQKLVNQLMVIEEKEKRNKFADGIIRLMGDMYPHLRDIPDFKHKLWDHLAIMSDFKLDIDSPYPKPDKETLYEKPKRLDYQQGGLRYKHYGKVIVVLIEYACAMEEGEERDVMVSIIANHMKKQYLRWNRDAVENSIIIRDMIELSNGKIVIPENLKITDTRDLKTSYKNVKKKKKIIKTKKKH